MCYRVVEICSLGKVLSSEFLSICPPIYSLFALKHSAETVIVLIRARQSPNVRGICDTSVVKMLSLQHSLWRDESFSQLLFPKPHMSEEPDKL